MTVKTTLVSCGAALLMSLAFLSPARSDNAPVGANRTTSLAGDWTGPLQGAADLHLIFHIVAVGLSYSVTVDCPEQTLYSLAARPITSSNGSVTIGVSAVSGSFAGTLSADGKSINGFWSQNGATLPVVLTWHAPAPSQPLPVELTGDCSGALLIPATVLHLVVHFIHRDDGSTTAMVDSPDQGAKGLLGGIVTDVDGTISIPVPAVAGVFRGKLSDDRKSLVGFWNQGSSTLPLTLALAGPAPATVK